MQAGFCGAQAPEIGERLTIGCIGSVAFGKDLKRKPRSGVYNEGKSLAETRRVMQDKTKP